MKRAFAILLSLLMAVGLSAGAAFAQDATPGAGGTPPAAATPVAGTPAMPIATGLTTPRGFVWGADGGLYVALAGSGGTTAATEEAPVTPILGPFLGGLTGAVARIENGCPVAVATGLPSTIDAMTEVLGAEDVAFLGGELYVSADGGGPVHGNPDMPSGVYKVGTDGSVTLVADLSAFLRANPVATQPGDYDPDADGYRMVADEAAGAFWVIEPNSGGVLSVKPDGTVTRVADLSATHIVPDAIDLAPDGGVYVGTLTPVPFTDGTAKVVHIAADGTVTDVWTGLTAVTDVAVGPDGTLYASELSTGNLAEPPFLVPGSGKIVHQTGPDTSEDVATGLMLPVAIGFSPDGGLYVSMPAIGATNGEGVIAQISGPMDSMPAGECTPIPETLNPSAGGSDTTPTT